LTFIAAGASAALIACYGEEPPTPSGERSAQSAQSAEKDGVGSVGVALLLGSGIVVNTASYTISGPGGFSKPGTIDTSNSPSLSATIGGLPTGTGYSIAITATATDGATTCTGSAGFDVMAHATSHANVPMDCHEPAKKGSVLLSGTANICPAITDIERTPKIVGVNYMILLDAAAHDADNGPSPLAYSWSASSGTLSNANSMDAILTCTDMGVVTVTLTVSDGDSDPTCAAKETVLVGCFGPDAGP
jgi:hypothetical protein